MIRNTVWTVALGMFAGKKKNPGQARCPALFGHPDMTTDHKSALRPACLDCILVPDSDQQA